MKKNIVCPYVTNKIQQIEQDMEDYCLQIHGECEKCAYNGIVQMLGYNFGECDKLIRYFETIGEENEK